MTDRIFVEATPHGNQGIMSPYVMNFFIDMSLLHWVSARSSYIFAGVGVTNRSGASSAH
jgi:hypothetical protein